jgi:hypothetical protein
VRIAAWLLSAALVLVAPTRAVAQEDTTLLPIGAIVKRVLIDPTTYPPAVISYDAMLRDWKSSQPFFRHGYLEHNPRFTISGRPDDVPLSYADGRTRIFKDALLHLQLSALHNTAENVVERLLIARYPHQKKLIRVIGWIERGAYASYATYILSAQHYRQWRRNERLAEELGFQ